MNLRDIYRTFPPTEAEYILFNTQGNFSRIDHIIGNKTGLRKFKKVEVIPNIFSDHNGMKLEISNRRKIGKSINT